MRFKGGIIGELAQKADDLIQKIVEKFFGKFFKKLLTKSLSGDIIDRLSQKRSELR